MLYRPKNIAAVQIALGSLPGKMRVEIEPDVKISAKTVDDLRHLQSWPENVALAVPQVVVADAAVRVSSVHPRSRTSPKA
jgi:hypothetical protein